MKDLINKIKKVSDIYADEHSINRNDYWYILKIQEELGELTQSYLSNIWSGRDRWKTKEELKQKMSDEFADVFAQLLLFADKNWIDPEKAIEEKRLKYLN